jgi:hypothetical protein
MRGAESAAARRGAWLGLTGRDSGGTRNPTRGMTGIVQTVPAGLDAENHKAGEGSNGEVGMRNQ